MPELLTLDEVAKELKLERRTILAWVQRDKLPGIKIGGVWRVARVDLDGFLSRGRKHHVYGHVGGHIRGPFCEAFANQEEEWWRKMGGKAEAARLLNDLWHCTDTVPSEVRDAAADWLEHNRLAASDKEVDGIRQGCRYASLVRILKQSLEWVEEHK